MFRRSCARYRKLSLFSVDGKLSERDIAYLSEHSANCKACASYGAQVRLISDALREASLEAASITDFSGRVADAVRRERRISVANLRPALLGGVVAAFAVGAALQLVSRPMEFDTPEKDSSAFMRSAPGNIGESTPFELFDTPSRMVEDPAPYDV